MKNSLGKSTEQKCLIILLITLKRFLRQSYELSTIVNYNAGIVFKAILLEL